MGRRKIDISLIKTTRGRQTTFHKRKLGLIKKIRELVALTGAEIFCEIKFGKRLIRLGKHISSSGIDIQELPLTFDRSKDCTDLINLNENSSSSTCSSSSSSCKLIPSPASSSSSQVNQQDETHQHPRTNETTECLEEPVIYSCIPAVDTEQSQLVYPAASFQAHLTPVQWTQPVTYDGINFDVDSFFHEITASGNLNHTIYMNDVSGNDNFNNYYR